MPLGFFPEPDLGSMAGVAKFGDLTPGLSQLSRHWCREKSPSYTYASTGGSTHVNSVRP